MIRSMPEIPEEFTEDIFKVENYQQKESTMRYSFVKGLKKTIVAVVLVGLPIVIQVLPTDVMNLTLGAILNLLFNYLKVKTSQL